MKDEVTWSRETAVYGHHRAMSRCSFQPTGEKFLFGSNEYYQRLGSFGSCSEQTPHLDLQRVLSRCQCPHVFGQALVQASHSHGSVHPRFTTTRILILSRTYHTALSALDAWPHYLSQWRWNLHLWKSQCQLERNCLETRSVAVEHLAQFASVRRGGRTVRQLGTNHSSIAPRRSAVESSLLRDAL